MGKTFLLKVCTPSGVLFTDEINQITLTTPTGVVGILANHQPIVSSLLTSICYIYDTQNKKLEALVNNGIFKMDGKTLTIITDFFEMNFRDENNKVIELRKQIIEKAIENNKKYASHFDVSVENKLKNELKRLNDLTKH
jgi:F-type H+-transporting ATPase subunit epsilon